MLLELVLQLLAEIRLALDGGRGFLRAAAIKEETDGGSGEALSA
jgi:hypothetical protein